MLIFAQRYCFLGPRQLVRQKVNIRYLKANDYEMGYNDDLPMTTLNSVANAILPFVLSLLPPAISFYDSVNIFFMILVIGFFLHMFLGCLSFDVLCTWLCVQFSRNRGVIFLVKSQCVTSIDAVYLTSFYGL